MLVEDLGFLIFKFRIPRPDVSFKMSTLYKEGD